MQPTTLAQEFSEEPKAAPPRIEISDVIRLRRPAERHRRSHHSMENLADPPFRLDTLSERLWRETELIPLRAKPFALLRHMAENAGRLVTHDELRKTICPRLMSAKAY